MKRVVLLVLPYLFFVFLPSLVLAETISVDTIWSPSDGEHIIDSSFSVMASTTLTIMPGTIIKAKSTWYGGPSIYGKIIAHGTSDLPIIFTSLNGDVGGWQGLYFKQGSEGDFDFVDISYAGYGGDGFGDFVGIENDGGTLIIKHSNIHDNYRIINNGGGGMMSVGSGIFNKSGTLSVSDSVIDNNVWGIRVDSGTTTISNNIIKNNIDSTGYGPGYGVYAFGPEPLTLINNTFSGNRRTAYIDASKNFTHNGNTSEDIINRGFEMNGIISNDTTFTSGDLPYIIGSLTVNAGDTLTLEPGTILKMDDRYSSGSIVVNGNLIAKSAPEKKIYITSLKNDSVGGDTNGDGNASTPSPKNWSSIFLENGSKAEFDNVTISYGGYNANGEYLNIAAAIYQRGAQFTASNSVFEHNVVTDIFQDAGITTITKSELTNGDYSIWSRGGNITISQSSLTNHIGLAIYNENGPIIDAKNNWWGSPDGPNNIYDPNPTGTGNRISSNVDYIPFLTALPGSTPPIQTINPVVIIPGIMGSATKNGVLLIDPILHTYDDLIATLEANDYEKDKNLFTFPYEWRDSNIITANLLKEKISAVKAICNCNKVDLVAHSMGGLVAREYIQSGQYQNDVDQVIFLGTPHKGSPKAYLQWEGGASDRDAASLFVNTYFTAEAARNGFGTVFEYIHNRPVVSVQQLLPIFSYIKDKNTGMERRYPENYPQNIFLENLEDNKDELLNTAIKITNIVGDSKENKTIEKLRVIPSTKNGLWEHGQPENFYVPLLTDHGLERGIGDNTVTIPSANLDNSIENINVNSNHNRLPTITENRIFNLLTNKISSTNIDSSYNIDVKILLLQLLSPIDVVITAPDGKKIGKNFATGEEYNGISGAFYSGFNNGDEEYITIPNPMDGEYKIEVQGTGNGGEYGVLTSYISDNFATTTETEGITKPNQITELNTTINNQNPGNLETERKITLEVLIGDINGSYDLKWIKDKKTRDALIKQVEGAVKLQKRIETVYEKLPDGTKRKKRVEKIELKINKILLKLFEKELDFLFKKNKITKEALDLLKLDIKYLLDNN